MINRTLLALVAAGLLGGCGKKQEEHSKSVLIAPPPPSAPSTAAPPATPASEPTEASTANPGDDGVDPAIAAAIKKYVSKKGAPPRSWIDLTVEQGYLPGIPNGKDGKPMDFDNTLVRLKIKPL